MHCPVATKTVVVEARRLAHGGEFRLGGGSDELFRVEFLRDSVIKLGVSRDGAFEDRPTHAVSADLEGILVPCTWSEEQGLVRMATSGVEVLVRLDPFNVSVRRADGTIVMAEAPDGSDFYRAADEGFAVTRGCGAADAFYGLGQKTGRFDRRGRDLILWNSDVLNPNVSGGYREVPGDDPLRDPTSTSFDPYYISIPFFYHRASGRVAWEVFSATTATADASTFPRAIATASALRAGPTRNTFLPGRPCATFWGTTHG